MQATSHAKRDRLAEATILAPVGGLLLLLLSGLFGFSERAAFTAIGAIVLSVPFAGCVFIGSIRRRGPRMWLSLLGLITAGVFSLLIIGITAGVKRKADRARALLLEQQANETTETISSPRSSQSQPTINDP